MASRGDRIEFIQEELSMLALDLIRDRLFEPASVIISILELTQSLLDTLADEGLADFEGSASQDSRP